MMNTLKNRIFIVMAFFAIAGTMIASAQQLQLTEKNIDKVVKMMTLEEKARLLVGSQDADFKGYEGLEKKLIHRVQGVAGYTSAIPRFGIPATVLTDGPGGVRIDTVRTGDTRRYYATSFPINTCLSATWNPAIVSEVGSVMAGDALAFGCDVILGSGLNIMRSPLGARNFEYCSEDPVLSGKIAAAMVRGIQSKGVGACVKHIAGNSQETERFSVNEVISQRALRELYLRGFEIACKESDPWTAMSSYNRLNGPYTQANRELLTTLLRDEWGFKGIVMTDWTQKRETDLAVRAGNDLMEWGEESQMREIIDKVNSGELKMSDVDICVKRMLQYIVKTPTFRQYQFNNQPDRKAGAEITRRSAAEGMVLLKNDSCTLPLDGVKTAALFGTNSYRLMSCGRGAAGVNSGYVVSLPEAFAAVGIKATDDLTALYEQLIQFADNKNSMVDDWNLVLGRVQYPNFYVDKQIIMSQAEKADVAVITVGHQSGEGVLLKERKKGDVLDRPINGEKGFNLTEAEKEMIRNVSDIFHERGKKVIVVINAGNVMETASWKDSPDAILVAWQGGEQTGNSIVDILTGKVNPSGKLPMSWVVDPMDLEANENFPTTPRLKSYDILHKEGIYVGYRDLNTRGKAVSYPFGFGLSYTTFQYSSPVVKATKGGFKASVTVENTGKVAGKEVVQLYVSAPKGTLDKPANELKAFAKTRLLAPGERQTIEFSVTDYELASFDETASQWIADNGDYAVKFASSLNDVRATGNYTLKKAFTKKVNDILKPNKPL